MKAIRPFKMRSPTNRKLNREHNLLPDPRKRKTTNDNRSFSSFYQDSYCTSVDTDVGYYAFYLLCVCIHVHVRVTSYSLKSSQIENACNRKRYHYIHNNYFR